MTAILVVYSQIIHAINTLCSSIAGEGDNNQNVYTAMTPSF